MEPQALHVAVVITAARAVLGAVTGAMGPGLLARYLVGYTAAEAVGITAVALVKMVVKALSV